MRDKSVFADLLTRVRGGDSDAASELVRNYESAIRVAVRTRLSDPKLRRQFDSMDVCQSVLASFFLRAAAGHYDLRDPAQLVALLTKMAHNKLAMRPARISPTTRCTPECAARRRTAGTRSQQRGTNPTSAGSGFGKSGIWTYGCSGPRNGQVPGTRPGLVGDSLAIWRNRRRAT